MPRPYRNLIVVGHSGAGKSTLGVSLSRITKTPIIEVGHAVHRDAKESPRGLDALHHADQKIFEGKYCHFVERALEDGPRAHPLIVIGPRLPQEVKFLKQALGPTLVVSLTVPSKLRVARRVSRLPPGEDALSWLRHRDLVEREWGIETTIALSDLKIDAILPPADLAAIVRSEWWKGAAPIRARRSRYASLQEMLTSDRVVVQGNSMSGRELSGYSRALGISWGPRSDELHFWPALP